MVISFNNTIIFRFTGYNSKNNTEYNDFEFVSNNE